MCTDRMCAVSQLPSATICAWLHLPCAVSPSYSRNRVYAHRERPPLLCLGPALPGPALILPPCSSTSRAHCPARPPARPPTSPMHRDSREAHATAERRGGPRRESTASTEEGRCSLKPPAAIRRQRTKRAIRPHHIHTALRAPSTNQRYAHAGCATALPHSLTPASSAEWLSLPRSVVPPVPAACPDAPQPLTRPPKGGGVAGGSEERKQRSTSRGTAPAREKERRERVRRRRPRSTLSVGGHACRLLAKAHSHKM